MATKKKKKKTSIEIEGEAVFNSMDRRACRISLNSDKIIGPRRFEVDRKLLPADYEPAKYSITGTFSINLEVKEK